MTAFDNIKVNNWPATSNDLEDFLVLKLPLNDTAALTESLPVVVGSKTLSPKRTLTNSGVTTVTAVGFNYSAMTSSNANFKAGYPKTNLFDGSISTAAQPVNGSGNYVEVNFSPAITVNTKLEVYATLNTNQYDSRGIIVNGGSEYIPNVYGSTQWWDLTDSSISNTTGFTTGTLNSLRFTFQNASNSSANVFAIRIDDQILVDVSPKKHHDNNAVFGGTHQLTIPASPAFNLAGDFTYEAWTYQDAAVTNGTYISSAGYYSGSNAGNWVLRRSSATQIGFATYDGTSNEEYTELSASTSVNTWQHIALTRSGTTVQIFVDGVAGGSMTVSKGLEDGANNGLVIGNANVNDPWNGKFQDVRLYNGVAKYTSNFTPPSAILV